MKITKHLHAYFIQKNIPFFQIPGQGISIERRFYNYDVFKYLEEQNRVTFFDQTLFVTY